MKNETVLKIAMEQSAIDSSCDPKDFISTVNLVTLSRPNIHARKYLELPFSCDLTSYGNCVVASVSEELRDTAEKYINKYSPKDCFETPQIHELQREISKFGQSVCFMAEYWLPDVTAVKALECPYELRLLKKDEFEGLYVPEWSNALCEKRKELDVLAVAAYDAGRMVGMAGCSMDCETMWQIGVDVLPDYRRKGVASAMTSALALEVLSRDIVPFYCCAWSNIGSARNAFRSGFRPAWVQLTVKPVEFVNRMIADKD